MAAVDATVVRALGERAELARRVGDLRASDDAPPSSPSRDAEEIERLVADAGETLPKAAVRDVLRHLRSITRAIEVPARVTYAGSEGSLGYVAALRHFGPAAHLVACDGATTALDEVTRRRADYAVLPFVSSSEGPLQASISALTATDLVLVAEVEVSAQLSLMSATGNEADVERVYAETTNRQACRVFLTTAWARVGVLEVRSALEAVRLAADDHGAAALVPEVFGVAQGLVPVRSNVGDEADLAIRFRVAAAQPAARSGSDATVLVFRLHDQPGALFDVLRHFAERGINLRTIHSRPIPGERWDYLFYAEISGHATDRPVVTAIEAIRRQTRLVKVIGSFAS